MQPLTLEEIIRAIGGRPLAEPTPRSISRVGIDSRAVQPGELFFALRGERFDGHEFVPAALASGAAAAVVSDPEVETGHPGLADRLILVPDTLAALGALGAYYRGQIPAVVIGVTGSNGKTTTKFMIDQVLGSRRQGRAAVKSFNNSVGVPITLLSAERGDEYLVVEIGTNAPGEVAALSRLARPDIAVVVSIGEEHLEFLDNIEQIAEEETSVLAHVPPGGLAVVCFEALEQAASKGDARLNRVTFGRDAAADLRASRIEMTAEGLRFLLNERFEYRLPMIGPHNAINALAAIAVGRRFGMEHDAIAAALAAFRPPPMRMNVETRGAITVINDAYNANPTSMEAGLAALDAWSGRGRRVALLGEMHELGKHSERCHAALGRAAARSSAQLVVAIGRHAETVTRAVTTAAPDKPTACFEKVADAEKGLAALLQPKDVILLKGSRAAGIERLLPMIESIGPVRSASRVARRASPPGRESKGTRRSGSRGRTPRRTASRRGGSA